MKKFWGVMALFLLFGMAFANEQTCLTANNDKVCLEMNRNGDRYTLEAHTNDVVELRCQVEVPADKVGAKIIHVAGCDDEFTYDGSTRDDMNVFAFFEDEKFGLHYNVRNDDRSDLDGSNRSTSYNNYSNGSIDAFDVNINDTTIAEDDYVDLRIYAQDDNNDTVNDYEGDIKIVVYTYNGSLDYADGNDYYLPDSTKSFVRDDDGELRLNNVVKFKKSGTYRIKVYDRDDSRVYGWSSTIYVGNYKSNNDNNNKIAQFDVNVDDTTLKPYDYVDLKIYAEDIDRKRVYDYAGSIKIAVYKYEYGSTSSVSHYDYYIPDDTKEFDDRNNGLLSISTAVRFDSEGTYKIKVYDTHDSTIYGWSPVIYVNKDNTTVSNEDFDDFALSVSNTAPKTYEKLDLMIRAQDKYDNNLRQYHDKVYFTVFLRDNRGYYNEVGSDYVTIDDTYTLDIHNAEYERLYDYLYFKREGKYKIKVYNSDAEDTVYVTVDDNNTNNTVSKDTDFSLQITNGASYNGKVNVFYKNNWIDTKVQALDKDGNIDQSYRGTVLFKIYKYENGYFRLAHTNEYTMPSSSRSFSFGDDGELLVNNLLQIKEKGIYRIKVEDSIDGSKYDYGPLLVVAD